MSKCKVSGKPVESYRMTLLEFMPLEPVASGELSLDVPESGTSRYETEKDIISEYDKGWNSEYGYTKCPICQGNNVKIRTRSGWWVHYFECKDCDRIMEYNHGDHMGGGRDSIWNATEAQMLEDLEGKYGKNMKLDV